MSVNKGTTVNFKIKSAVGSAYKIDIYRLGYYARPGRASDAGRRSRTPARANAEPSCRTTAPGWSTAATGRRRPPGPCRAPRSPASTSPTSSATTATATARSSSSCATTRARRSCCCRPPTPPWQAYNTYGGNNLYDCAIDCPDGNPRAYKAAYKVSYNRPLGQPYDGVSSLFDGAEYSMIRFLERKGYDMSYTSENEVGRRRRGCSTTRSSSPAATTSTGRPRSAAPSRPRATPASASRSSAATRCSGRRAGSRARWTARPTARSSPTRTRTSTRASTRSSGPAAGTTRASRSPATASRRRTR